MCLLSICYIFHIRSGFVDAGVDRVASAWMTHARRGAYAPAALSARGYRKGSPGLLPLSPLRIRRSRLRQICVDWAWHDSRNQPWRSLTRAEGTGHGVLDGRQAL